MISEETRRLRRNAAAGIYPPDAMPNWVHASSAGRARHHWKLFAAILRDGVIAGALASALIASFLVAASTLSGRPPLHIAALLGGALLSDAGGLRSATSLVLGYTVIHTVVLVAFGVVTAALARLAAAALQGWYIAAIGLAFIAVHIVALPIWFGEAVQSELSLWLVSAATSLGIAAMCAFLWWRNPAILTVAHEPDEPAG